jgi:serine/threonine protein kinase
MSGRTAIGGGAAERSGRVRPPSADPAAEISPLAASAKTFGKYRLLAELGRGGMADVHLGVTLGPAGFSKLQVIKRLRPGMTDEAEMRQMMLDEARLAARLNHKNIVQTNEVGIVDEQYFLAMEYLDGQPYHRIVKRAAQLGRAIPLPFAMKILCEVLSGLHYAHEVCDYDGVLLGVVHRDVSPQNVFVTYDGQVKVVDFGIAKSTGRLVETQTGIIRGKLTYMAPEQAFANEIDRRADLFSVGVLLWEAIAGERLWGNMSDPEIVSHLMREIPLVTTVRPDAPADLVDLCTRALSRDPEKRPATAAEMRGEIEGYLASHDIQVNAEALGALVVDFFAAERDELQKFVDHELALLRIEGDALETSDITATPRRLSEPSAIKRNLLPATAIPGSPGVPMRIPHSTMGLRDAASAPYAPNPNSPIGSAVRMAGLRPTETPTSPLRPGSPQPPDSSGGPTIPRVPSFDVDDIMTARELSPPGAVLSNPPPSSVTEPSATVSWANAASTKSRHPLVYGAVFAAIAATTIVVARISLFPGGSTLAADSATPATAPLTAVLPPASVTAATTAPAAASAQPDDSFVRIRITTNPLETKILVDGSPLPSSPFEGKFMKDGAVHRITVEGSGFYPQSRMVVFDKDQHLDFILHSKKGLPPPKDSPYR